MFLSKALIADQVTLQALRQVVASSGLLLFIRRLHKHSLPFDPFPPLQCLNCALLSSPSSPAMVKDYRIYSREEPNHYSLLMDCRNRQDSIILESGVAANLTEEETETVKANYTKIMDAYACLGVLTQQVAAGAGAVGEPVQFLVLVTGCAPLGKMVEHEVVRITATAFLSLRNRPQDEEIVADVKKLLNSGIFFYGRGLKNGENFDMTQSAQRKHLGLGTDHRFFWNRSLHLFLERFGVDCDEWLAKIVCGGFEVRKREKGREIKRERK